MTLKIELLLIAALIVATLTLAHMLQGTALATLTR